MRRTLLAILALLAAGHARAERQCPEGLDLRTPTSRFTDNGDGTVTDGRTGLTWQRCALGTAFVDGGLAGVLVDDGCTPAGATTFTWEQALQAAEALDQAGGYAGFTDWRLPNRKELESIVETACRSPALNTIVFPGAPRGWYLSSTPTFTSSTFATSVHAVEFFTGRVGAVSKTSLYPVRLVRGP